MIHVIIEVHRPKKGKLFKEIQHIPMSESGRPSLGINSWLEDELYTQYLHDQRAVDESWRKIFEANGVQKGSNGHGASTEVSGAKGSPNPLPSAAEVPAVSGEQLLPLRGPALRIAQNMTASLALPTATSQRVLETKVLEEARRMLNESRAAAGKGKLSFTHLIGWAIVKSLGANPNLNHSFAQVNGEAHRAARSEINLGIAVDVAGKDGARSLKVPNIKNAGALTFEQFVKAFDDIVARARTNKLLVSDFEGTTISLTNPGTVGTFGSIPRLMPGTGAIIATGAIDFPAGFREAAKDKLAELNVSKVMMVTCTYDHRVIQGAESGIFLARLDELLRGQRDFFKELGVAPDLTAPAVYAEASPRAAAPARGSDIAKQAAVMQLVHAFRSRGHLLATIDPLGEPRPPFPALDPATYGLTESDLDGEFLINNVNEHGTGNLPHLTLREILDLMRKTYCGNLACEYMYIQSPTEKLWLQLRMEPVRNAWPLEKDLRTRSLQRIVEAEEFEHFLHTRFIGHKRFSLEGAESAVAILDEILDRGGNGVLQEAVIGMAHRGRLTVLANIVGKSMVQVFSEFEGIDPDSTQGSGDVKYHLGASGTFKTSQGKDVTVAVAFNPSHLEAVDPVVEGIVRPKQDRAGDTERARIIPILIHGDAAFAGQGVVAETLNLSQLEGYKTGGTIHLIINNQIGFTTNPHEARSSAYATDMARLVQAPIFHVNGDDVEACVRVAQLAYDYRQQFKKDVVIDMVCYRRWGHNEADDPSYTQPALYRKIKDQPSVGKQYAQKLIAEKTIDAERPDAIKKAAVARLNAMYDESKKASQKYEVQELNALNLEPSDRPSPETPISKEMARTIIEGLAAFPSDFHLHPKLKGFVDKRKEVLNGTSMDWATGEALAFGSLVLEGTPVRLSGQDSGRGTFSQRHLEFSDYESGKSYIPMQHLSAQQAKFDVIDSSLSEYAVMGFEFGFSVADPWTLVLWEAQFGDFANGAQILIDQFIASAETKWSQPSGLVLLLPHGFEGQGPEHSSARMERFLQLCGENNMQIVNASTPAQYFHLLRRQMNGGPDRRGVRKPLIVFTPKRMLRDPRAVSTLEEVTSGRFHEVLPDTSGLDAGRVTRVLFCCGQLYYDLAAARKDRKDVAICRMEQLYPFAFDQVKALLAQYPSANEVVWVQEEPRNMGAWRSVQENFLTVLEGSKRVLRYVGRAEAASPAAGSLKRHQQEQAELVENAFAVEIKKPMGRRRKAGATD